MLSQFFVWITGELGFDYQQIFLVVVGKQTNICAQYIGAES